MGWEGWFTLAVVAAVFVGLARSLAPPDVLLLGGMLAVSLVGILTPEEAFVGFANEGVLTVAALFVVAAGLSETGALERLSRRVMGQDGRETSAILRMALPVLTASAFLNNTPVVAMFMSMIRGWCRRHRISPSRLMIPLSYIAILGGTCTLIGTSTNLVINGMMINRAQLLAEQLTGEQDPLVREQLEKSRDGLRGLSMFELGYLGVPYALVGLAYLALIGRRLLPDRKDLLEQLGDSPREYVVDMEVQPGCGLIGQRVDAAGLRHLPGLFVIQVTRGEQVIAPVGPDLILQAGDRLTFTGVVSTIVDLERIPGLVPVADDAYVTEAGKRRAQQLCEAVISNTSPLVGKNIRDANFRAYYNAAVVAVHRGGTRLLGRIGDIVLRAGDTLLLQTGPHFAQAHRNNPDFYLVSGVEESRPVRHDRARIGLVLLLVLIVLMASGWMPIVVAAFFIAGLMIVTRCISASVARQNIDLQVLLTIAGALGLATALQKTGAAAVIAHTLVDLTSALGPRGTLITVYLITMLFTELITNNAAAALIFPFVVVIAEELGVSPRPFVVAVTFAASASFATPIGYQTNMMVYGPGGYRFTDFLRVGVPLSLLLAVVATLLIPMIWPF